MLVMSMFLAACGGKEKTGTETKPKEEKTKTDDNG